MTNSEDPYIQPPLQRTATRDYELKTDIVYIKINHLTVYLDKSMPGLHIAIWPTNTQQEHLILDAYVPNNPEELTRATIHHHESHCPANSLTQSNVLNNPGIPLINQEK